MVDSDVMISNVVGDMQEVRVTLANPQFGDTLVVDSANLPTGVQVKSQSADEIILEAVSTSQTEATFDTALKTIGFTTSSADLTARVFNVGATNELGLEGNTATTSIYVVPDVDGDGVSDHLDLDSDNDGITDNIEAQTTDEYIAPSGVGGTVAFIDTNNDGLDDNYDAGIVAGGVHTGVGLTPVNTDAGLENGDDAADYQDTDADNDNIDDAAENGLGAAIRTGLSTPGTDADGDGLFDVFELSLIHI